MLLQNRIKHLGIAHEAQVGEVDAVYRGLAVVTDDVAGRKEVDVLFAPLLQGLEESVQGLILLLYFTGDAGVEGGMGEDGVFNKKYRGIGMLATDDGIKAVGTLFHLLDGGVGHKVEHKHGSVYAGDDVGNLQVEQGVAAEAQVDALTIEPALQDIGVRHAGTGSAAALQDAGAIEYDRFAAFRQVHRRSGNVGKGVYTDGEGGDAVVQGKV